MTTALRSNVSPACSFAFTRRLAAGVFALLASYSAATAANAERYAQEFEWRRGHAATGSLVSVEVRVDGHRASLYRSPAQWDRYYFEAVRGHNYALRIRNRTGRRVGVLIAVDGLNVVNGERSALSGGEPMYVLDAWGSATIRGWRTSLEDVQRFVFVDEGRSYASRSDQANGDMGWIRVLAFEEERPVAWFQGEDGRLGGNDGACEKPAGDAAAPSRQERATKSYDQEAPPTAERQQDATESFPGTGWGDRRRDPVRRVWFDPALGASDHLVLRYEFASGLRALGIFPQGDRLTERERGECGFAQPARW